MQSKYKNNLTVSDDQNWRSVINNEFNYAKQWEGDWGFLTHEGKKIIQIKQNQKLLEKRLVQIRRSNSLKKS